jgi:hypothetical protein
MRPSLRFATVLGAAFAAILALHAKVAHAEEPYAAGHCAVTRAAVPLRDAHGEIVAGGATLPTGSSLKILSVHDDLVEVAWIPSLMDDCARPGGVFAGWLHRGAKVKEYEKVGRNPYPSAHSAEAMPLFDAPDGKVVTQARMNGMLWIIVRKGDWELVTSGTGTFAPKDESWRPTKGWVPVGSLEPFVLADPSGPVSGGETAAIRYSDSHDDGFDVRGRRHAWDAVCGTEVKAVFLTRVEAWPVAVFCSDWMDGGEQTLSLVPIEGKPRTKTWRKGDGPTSDAKLLKILRALLAPPRK